MAKRKRQKASMPRWSIAALVVVAVAVAFWFGYQHLNSRVQESERAKILKTPASDKVDSTNEGLQVHVTGLLTADGPARDPQIGVSAAAAILLRNVEIFAWREHCAGVACSYDTGWGVPVDSSRFREPKGHENPPAPFASAIFAAPGLKLGAYRVDANLLLRQHPSKAWPVSDKGLPLNMAASFSAANGMLYAGGDRAQPQVGMLRVSYRAVPLDTATLDGVQRDGVLTSK